MEVFIKNLFDKFEGQFPQKEKTKGTPSQNILLEYQPSTCN